MNDKGGDRWTRKDVTDGREKAAIKFALGTHESLRERCIMCGKAVHPSRLTSVQGKYGGAPDKLCPDCLKEYKLKKAEEATQRRMADLSIENNRLRSRLEDLANEYDRYKTGAIFYNWIAIMAGILIGGIMTFLIYK